MVAIDKILTALTLLLVQPPKNSSDDLAFDVDTICEPPFRPGNTRIFNEILDKFEFGTEFGNTKVPAAPNKCVRVVEMNMQALMVCNDNEAEIDVTKDQALKVLNTMTANCREGTHDRAVQGFAKGRNWNVILSFVGPPLTPETIEPGNVECFQEGAQVPRSDVEERMKDFKDEWKKAKVTDLFITPGKCRTYAKKDKISSFEICNGYDPSSGLITDSASTSDKVSLDIVFSELQKILDDKKCDEGGLVRALTMTPEGWLIRVGDQQLCSEESELCDYPR